jgi:hypothetical protein
MSVTASLGSFSFLRELGRREARFLPERLGADRFALRLAIMGGIVLQLAKTASGFICRTPSKSGPLRKAGPTR